MSLKIENIMAENVNMRSLAAQGKCPFCEKDINIEDFRDTLSIKEYHISGMCQSCQDDFFKEE